MPLKKHSKKLRLNLSPNVEMMMTNHAPRGRNLVSSMTRNGKNAIQMYRNRLNQVPNKNTISQYHQAKNSRIKIKIQFKKSKSSQRHPLFRKIQMEVNQILPVHRLDGVVNHGLGLVKKTDT